MDPPEPAAVPPAPDGTHTTWPVTLQAAVPGGSYVPLSPLTHDVAQAKHSLPGVQARGPPPLAPCLPLGVPSLMEEVRYSSQVRPRQAGGEGMALSCPHPQPGPAHLKCSPGTTPAS